MAARGGGSIVNVTTMAAEFEAPQMALYGSSKAALVLLTKSWAAEYGPSGVRVNAVSPGPTRTEGTAGMGEALDQLASAAPGRSAGASGGDRLGHRVPGRRRGRLRPGRAAAGRRRPSRRLSGPGRRA
jgi:NAD(P)-dependent dehydrogenase (short-subunit alcohol dehydrogenase family)